MNSPVTNLISLPTPTPKPSANAPAGRRAPEKPSPSRAANKGAENPKSNSRPARRERDTARGETPAKASHDSPVANRRANAVKSSKSDKTGKKVASADPNVAAAGLETQIIGKVALAGSTALFATILQAAGQTVKTVAPHASKAKAAVSPGRRATLGTAPESKVTLHGLASVRTTGEPAKLEKPVAPGVTVPITPDVLRKALTSVVSAKARRGKGVTGEKPAAPVAATGKNPLITPKMAVTPGLAAQVSDQTHKATQPDVPQASEILKQPPLALMPGAVSAADKIAHSAKPNSRPAARGKVALQTKSSQQANVPASAAQSILHKRLGALSQGVDRQAQFVVKEPTRTGQNSVVSSQTTPAETAASGAVRGAGDLAANPPVKQITEAFRSSASRNGQEIVVRLNPPELGRVRVTLRLEGGEVRGVLEVENPKTLSQLQREAPNIMARLTDAGIEMKRMDLSLSENGSRDSMRDPAWFSQQYGENGSGQGGWGARGQGLATDEALSGPPDSEGELQPVLMATGDDSINIWI